MVLFSRVSLPISGLFHCVCSKTHLFFRIPEPELFCNDGLLIYTFFILTHLIYG